MHDLQPVSQTLLSRLFSGVDNPARYIGGEPNAVIKESGVRGRMALCFPDVYELADENPRPHRANVPRQDLTRHRPSEGRCAVNRATRPTARNQDCS